MKKQKTYIYPAILTYEDGYDIAITFPDLPGCTSCAKNESEILSMAREALGGHIYCMEEMNEKIPTPTKFSQMQLASNEKAILVDVFMPSVRLANENKAVNRTVTLPAWLNALALEHEVNFSQVLQEALKQQFASA